MSTTRRLDEAEPVLVVSQALRDSIRRFRQQHVSSEPHSQAIVCNRGSGLHRCGSGDGGWTVIYGDAGIVRRMENESTRSSEKTSSEMEILPLPSPLCSAPFSATRHQSTPGDESFSSLPHESPDPRPRDVRCVSPHTLPLSLCFRSPA